uniref:hypothetical protein n=1 Tax=Clostridium sp. NkU-1 TaxID=1095009 RepID=UPI00326066F5
MTVEIWFEQWMKDFRGIRIKPGTKEVYRNTYNAHIMPVLGKKTGDKYSYGADQRLYNDMAAKDYAEGTIKLVSVILFGMFKTGSKIRADC